MKTDSSFDLAIDSVSNNARVRITCFYKDHFHGDIEFPPELIDDLILELRKIQKPIRVESPVE